MIYGEKFLKYDNSFVTLSVLENDRLQLESTVVFFDECASIDILTESKIGDIFDALFTKVKKFINDAIDFIDKIINFVIDKVSKFVNKLLDWLRKKPKPKNESAELLGEEANDSSEWEIIYYKINYSNVYDKLYLRLKAWTKDTCDYLLSDFKKMEERCRNKSSYGAHYTANHTELYGKDHFNEIENMYSVVSKKNFDELFEKKTRKIDKYTDIDFLRGLIQDMTNETKLMIKEFKDIKEYIKEFKSNVDVYLNITKKINSMIDDNSSDLDRDIQKFMNDRAQLSSKVINIVTKCSSLIIKSCTKFEKENTTALIKIARLSGCDKSDTDAIGNELNTVMA